MLFETPGGTRLENLKSTYTNEYVKLKEAQEELP
jgi:hypothetical protein